MITTNITKFIRHKNSPFFLPLRHHQSPPLPTSTSLHYHHTTPSPMEIEVKLRLPNSTTHQRLTTLLSPHLLTTHFQENIFFDTPTSTLSSNFAALRLRFYNLDSRCIISLKSNPTLSNGISRIQEDEEPLDPSIARACVAEPRRLLMMDSSRIMKRVKREYGISEDDDELVCLGGFRNVRNVYDWKGVKLEVDETDFHFGTCYEVECESCEPEKVKILIEEFLKSNGIEYEYSNVSKFAVFRSGKMP